MRVNIKLIDIIINVISGKLIFAFDLQSFKKTNG